MFTAVFSGLKAVSGFPVANYYKLQPVEAAILFPPRLSRANRIPSSALRFHLAGALFGRLGDLFPFLALF